MSGWDSKREICRRSGKMEKYYLVEVRQTATKLLKYRPNDLGHAVP